MSMFTDDMIRRHSEDKLLQLVRKCIKVAEYNN